MDTNQFQGTIAKSREILVVLPKNPSFDAVAAGLSLFVSLKNYGKKLGVFCPTSMLVEFNRLVGVEQVTDSLGSKNLTVALRDYPANNVERVSYDIENNEMRLTIIPKDGAAPPTAEQITTFYSGMSSDTVIFVGVDDEAQFGELGKELQKVPQIISILDDRRPQGFPRRRGVLEFVEPMSSCLSETIGLLLTSSNLPLDGDIAGNLMLGVRESTGNLTSNKVRAETFELLAHFMRAKASGRSGMNQGTSQEIIDDGSTGQQEEQQETPSDWLKPKIYKGSTLP